METHVSATISYPNIGQATLSFGPTADGTGVELHFNKTEYPHILAMLQYFDAETLSIIIRNGRPLMRISSLTRRVEQDGEVVTITDMFVKTRPGRRSTDLIRIRLRTIVEALKENFTVAEILSQKEDAVWVTVWSPTMQDLVVDTDTF